MKKHFPLLLLLLCALLLGGVLLYPGLRQSAAPAEIPAASEPSPAQSAPPTASAIPSPIQNASFVAPSQPMVESPAPVPEDVPPAPSESAAPVETPAVSEPPAPVETPAADSPLSVTVYDAEGNPVSLSDYSGLPTVLTFWTSWCRTCQGELPKFHAACQALDGEVQLLMVNLTPWRDTVEAASAYAEEQGFTCPVLYDTEGSCPEAYGIQSLPTTLFLDAEGSVISRVDMTLSQEELQEHLAQIQS